MFRALDTDQERRSISNRLGKESVLSQIGHMRMTVDIPEGELEDVMRFTRAQTRSEAIVTSITEFNGRCRMTELTRRAETSTEMMTTNGLQRARRRESHW